MQEEDSEEIGAHLDMLQESLSFDGYNALKQALADPLVVTETSFPNLQHLAQQPETAPENQTPQKVMKNMMNAVMATRIPHKTAVVEEPEVQSLMLLDLSDLDAKLKQLFLLMDSNGDGQLSQEEFEHTCGRPNLHKLLATVLHSLAAVAGCLRFGFCGFCRFLLFLRMQRL